MVRTRGGGYHRPIAPTRSSDLTDLLVLALSAQEKVADDTDAKVLDAALVEFAEHGTDGATIDAIAIRAGVARMTVFRRFGSKTALIERVIVRELRRFLLYVDRAITALDDPAERIAEAFVACVRVGAAHPLVSRMVTREQGATLERLAAGDPSPLELARQYVAARIRVDTPQVEDIDAAADVLVRLALTYVLVPSTAVDLGDEDAARDFARRVLAPIIR